MQLRKIALCVEAWWSEENHFAWNFTRKRLLQEGQSPSFADRIYVVHVHTKGKEIEHWDKGTPVLGDVRTELATYDHSVTELHVIPSQLNHMSVTVCARQGDVVNSIVQFIAEEGIHVAILSERADMKVQVWECAAVLGLKDQNRVKKTLSMRAANQILSKAPCACTIVSPRFSAGDHFRIQAKLQPDTLVANSAMQFRRRVAVVLNSSLWDSSLTQYVAKNVIVPGDRVILVRCLNENLNKKNAEELQIERDYLRELGWHKFKRTRIALAVEVIKNHTRILCEFIEEKGVDLLIMARSDSNKLKRSIKKDHASFQTFPHKSPCPFMIVPTEVLRGCARFLPDTPSTGHQQEHPMSPFRNTPGFSHSLFNRKTWSAAFNGQNFRLFGPSRRCLSLDISERNQGLQAIEYINRDDSIELSSSAMPDFVNKETQLSFKSTDQLINGGGGSSSEAPVEACSMAPPAHCALRVDIEECKRDVVLRRLQTMLTEKEKEVVALKQRIRHLQSI